MGQILEASFKSWVINYKLQLIRVWSLGWWIFIWNLQYQHLYGNGMRAKNTHIPPEGVCPIRILDVRQRLILLDRTIFAANAPPLVIYKTRPPADEKVRRGLFTQKPPVHGRDAAFTLAVGWATAKDSGEEVIDAPCSRFSKVDSCSGNVCGEIHHPILDDSEWQCDILHQFAADSGWLGDADHAECTTLVGEAISVSWARTCRSEEKQKVNEITTIGPD